MVCFVAPKSRLEKKLVQVVKEEEDMEEDI